MSGPGDQLIERLEYAGLGAALALPGAVQRRLVGPPRRADGPPLALDVQTVLWLQEAARKPQVAALPIAEGREALDRQVRTSSGRWPVGEVRRLSVDGADGPLTARLYVPRAGGWPAALLVFLHGGGFVYGGLDSHDATSRFLAERAGVRVLAVDYRLAPEHRHPAQRADAFAAYRWAVANAERLGADPGRIGVGGDSAGGWLAAAVALAAAREAVPCAFQLLIYPMTDPRGATSSRARFAEGYYLTGEFMDLAESSWLRPGHDRSSPDVCLVLAEIPEGLAPAYVATAGFDPLRDEGEAYAEHLRAAGVAVQTRRFGDQIHGFVNPLRVASCRSATQEIADALRTALA